MLADSSTRRVILIGIVCSMTCLGYFYMLDRVFFSSADFAPIFQTLLVFYDGETVWLSVAVCLLAAVWNKPTPVIRLVDSVAHNRSWVVSISVAAIALGSILIYHSYAFSMDEYAAVFQAKTFAAGQVYARLPPSLVDWLVVPGFNGTFLFASRLTGKAIEGYSPGFAMLLAPFELIGAPWLCNAILAGLAVYLVYRITVEITGDERAGGWAMLFTLSSGAFLANAISYYSMEAHLTANLLFAFLLIKPTMKRCWFAGLVGSLALILHNPLPHTLFALPWIASLAINKGQRQCLVPLILGYIPGLVLYGAWLWLRSDIVPVVNSVAGVSGVSSGVFMLPDVVMLQMRAASITKAWIWAVPCLFVFAFLGVAQHRHSRPVRLLTQSAALTFIAYLFVRLDQGHGWGYRYFHSAWGVIPILAGCAIDRAEARHRLAAFAGAASVLSLLVIVPFQMYQIHGIISRHLAQVQSPQRPGNNVYFIPPGAGFYSSDMVQVDPRLRDRDLLLASRGAKLDFELVRQNWPSASIVPGRFFAQHWYLGDTDQRQTSDDTAGAARHFAPTFTPSSNKVERLQ